jgi:hypothetical protein
MAIFIHRNGLCYIYIHSALNTGWNLSNLTEQSDFNLYIPTMAPPPEPLTAAKNDAPLKTKEFKAPIKGVAPYKDVPEWTPQDLTETPLPAGYTRCFDEMNRPYYQNENTQTSSWLHPVKLQEFKDANMIVESEFNKDLYCSELTRDGKIILVDYNFPDEGTVTGPWDTNE